MTFANFGGNVRFEPTWSCTPENPCAVLNALKDAREGHVRARGSLHAWSDAAATNGATLDLRNLNEVSLQTRPDGSVCVDVGAGCTVDAVLEWLRSRGYTLPVYGIIGKQTIAGAIATATHGSGRESMSHYVVSLRAAAYDARGNPMEYTWDEGDALRAARCGVGCAGIVLAVRMRVEPDYLIEEQKKWFDRIDPILQLEPDFPRQQFYLVPWSWKWFAQLRRPRPGPVRRPNLKALVHRLLQYVAGDFLLHGIIAFLAGVLSWDAAVRWFYRHGFPIFTSAARHVTDDSAHILKMRQDIFRHVEMELFVPAPHVRHAAQFVEWVLRTCGGESIALPGTLSADRFGRDIAPDIGYLRGSYVHDYIITFRRVGSDDTLISMTSGSHDAWYAISLITYRKKLRPFLDMARFLATAMASAYGARPHWGKICPLDAEQLENLYPDLPLFRTHCASVDPNQVFVNDFARRLLGFQ